MEPINLIFDGAKPTIESAVQQPICLHIIMEPGRYNMPRATAAVKATAPINPNQRGQSHATTRGSQRVYCGNHRGFASFFFYFPSLLAVHPKRNGEKGKKRYGHGTPREESHTANHRHDPSTTSPSHRLMAKKSHLLGGSGTVERMEQDGDGFYFWLAPRRVAGAGAAARRNRDRAPKHQERARRGSTRNQSGKESIPREIYQTNAATRQGRKEIKRK